ncbi:CxxH/CxxC protein [Saccharibacillus sp. CPCC 101409]|uniref:CxxH/CxxC protein n=1 Tax=Saccharibacillus sp. CPCC 101409 TaxID=3058041 RepID=UPI0026732F9F|nr:CxxH/CxxC protein [Saccharibacillus sp. CPCC 101409]MDO3409690.1 CxxH/CxxC protein [Saccharibacillus sp. CPCC 101409]
MYCVCKQHIEKALEDFVDEYEDAPDLVNLKETEFSDWDPPVQCAHCEQPAEVLVV